MMATVATESARCRLEERVSLSANDVLCDIGVRIVTDSHSVKFLKTVSKLLQAFQADQDRRGRALDFAAKVGGDRRSNFTV